MRTVEFSPASFSSALNSAYCPDIYSVSLIGIKGLNLREYEIYDCNSAEDTGENDSS